jgi:ribosomal protein S18 acetylase RimI-like enzyme
VVPLPECALEETARLHVEQLPHGLFPALGQRFLLRWHETFIVSPVGIALAAVGDDGRVWGFLVGTSDQRRHTAEVVRRHGRSLALCAAGALLRRPRVLVHFLRTRALPYARRVALTVARRSPDAPSAEGQPSGPVAVLHAVATFPAARGKGVGAALVTRYEEVLAERGIPHMQLVTQAEDGAAEFYRRLGYQESDRRPNRDGDEVIQFDCEPGTDT